MTAKIIFLVLTFCIMPLSGMKRHVDPSTHVLHTYEMPDNVVADIITHLASSVGTPQIRNKKDIPVIIKYVKSFSLVNKDIYAKIHTPVMVQIFITSLADRFRITPLDAAGEINTPGTREWIKQYLKKTEEYELFKVMHRIFDIAHKVRKEFKPLDFFIRDGQKESSRPNPFYSQTKQGFFISADGTPHELYTPWGKVMLFGGGCGKQLAFPAFCQAFLKRFKISFAQVTTSGLDTDKVKFRKLICKENSHEVINIKEMLLLDKNISYRNIYKKISKEKLAALHGQEVLIFSDYCGYESLYKLHSVDDFILPEPELLPEKQYRSYKVTNIIWDILQDRYNEEHKACIVCLDNTGAIIRMPCKNNHPAYICISCYQTIALQKNTCPLCYKPLKKIQVPIEKIEETKMYDKPKKKILITSLQTASQECIKLIQQLNDQPLFTGTGSIVATCKVLCLESWSDCRIIDILCTNAIKKLTRSRAWHVNDFGSGNHRLCDADGKDLGNGITLWLYDKYMLTQCPLQELHTLFDEMLTILTTGWQRSTLIENPHIHKKSEEEWYLFIKPNLLHEEDTLMRFFITANYLENDISCDSTSEVPRIVYIWIKKKSYEEVKQILGLS
jgi:hypothetical protein